MSHLNEYPVQAQFWLQISDFKRYMLPDRDKKAPNRYLLD